MFERELWKETYLTTPGWPCPKCKSGRLQCVSDGLSDVETSWSEEGHSHPDWEPEWIVTRYSQRLICSDVKCGELCIVVGTGHVQTGYSYGPYGETERDHYNIYRPEFIHPSPSMISFVKETPEGVVKDIASASSLYWTDTSSSANKLRLVAERILTAKGVKRYTRSNGKRKPLTLYARIDIFKKKEEDIAELLHSIRFLGNHGSHESDIEVGREDLLDAFEIIEHVIDLVFSKKAERVERAAKSITKRKGKPAAKGRRRKPL